MLCEPVGTGLLFSNCLTQTKKSLCSFEMSATIYQSTGRRRHSPLSTWLQAPQISRSKCKRYAVIFCDAIISHLGGESVVFIMTNRIRTARSGVPFPAEAIDFCLEKAQTVSEAHPTSYLIGTGVLPGQQSGQTVKLTTHLDLQPRVRRIGIIYAHNWTFWRRGERRVFVFVILLFLASLRAYLTFQNGYLYW
jgi:hypothetical protein